MAALGSAGRRRLSLLVALLLALLPGGSAVSAQRPAPAEDCLAVGAYVAPPEGGDPQRAFRDAGRLMGPLTVRRSFDGQLPASFATSAAAGDRAAGVRSFVSWKPPGGDVRGAAEGRYDDRVAAWARSVPGTGVHATAVHEPENDMAAADFVALHRHLYSVVKAANPTIRWGPVYMAYWWDPAQPDHYVGDPASWWPGADAADFVGLDWYGIRPEPMTADPSFLHWYEQMAPTDLPLLIVEYGQYAVRPGETTRPELERARAAAIRRDAAWIARHPRIDVWLYWQGSGPNGDWRMRDAASLAAWREVAAGGCPA
ncbi:hypothetical protein ACU610_24070 [Geodermatophilus sp. URMC 61]|uniref:hypothetical protein n=1 Tax=Geodermatophilus sp. URMC 61 TaxID=3423411 RepID=UPI00406D23A5